MVKFRTRLFIIFIMLIGFSVISSGFFIAQMVQDSHLETLRDGMMREMRIIAGTVDWPQAGDVTSRQAALGEVARKMKVYSGERVTFIDADGTVLGDSDHDPMTMDNHLDREEVQQAAEAGAGYAVRHSETKDSDMLYTALVYPQSEVSSTQGYIRLAVGLEQVEAMMSRLWTSLVVGLFACFAIAGLISYRIAGELTKRLETATDVAKQIARLNYGARIPVTGKDEIGQLSKAVNAMADSLQDQLRKISHNEEQLSGVLDNLVSGVMLIDNEGVVRMLNKTAEDMLGRSVN